MCQKHSAISCKVSINQLYKSIHCAIVLCAIDKTSRTCDLLLDVIVVDRDILVAVRTALLMLKPNSMAELVRHGVVLVERENTVCALLVVVGHKFINE